MEGLPELTEPVQGLEGHEAEEDGTLRLTESVPFVLHQQPVEG